MAERRLIHILIFIAVASSAVFFAYTDALASTNIDGENHWAWNDVVGWIDFQPSANPNVMVYDDRIDGYANALQIGDIQLNCSTPPPGGADSCLSAGNWKVLNDGNGKLSGWAWNDQIGWISFRCDEAGTDPNLVDCTAVQYGVDIDGSLGNFSGWAWNDVIGWISFSSVNTGFGAQYRVKTSWSSAAVPSADLVSSIFDTCPGATNCGAGINTIMWQGDPKGGRVSFQIASSDDSAGPWVFYGPDKNSGDYYSPVGPNIPAKITSEHNNKRYVRYKVFLSRYPGDPSPVVQNVIINWNP